MPNINTECLKANLKKQHNFICNKKGHILVFADYWKNRTPANYSIEGQSSKLSEEFLRRHAFDLGIQAMKWAKAQAIDHEKMNDDLCPEVHIDWGVGMTAAFTTGGDVIFEDSTTYTTGPIIETWDDFDNLKFSLDNKWVSYALEFWHGAESEYAEGIAVTPNVFRSPLDLANDIRGNDLFLNLYDYPENVEILLNLCADSIIELDKIFRSEIRILRESPGGVWGVALPSSGMIFLNGDTIDLIREDMCCRFNNPSVEKLINYAGSLYFHHHSIGVSRAYSVSQTKGTMIQEILQDPNGPKLLESIDDKLISASLETPIDFGVNLLESPNLDEILERLRIGRFFIHIATETLSDCQRIIEKIREYA